MPSLPTLCLPFHLLIRFVFLPIQGCYGAKTMLLMVFTGFYRGEGGRTVESSAEAYHVRV
jgi:hypothetical protein